MTTKSGLSLLSPFMRQFNNELSLFMLFEVDIMQSYIDLIK